ncbi:MAG: hypothetical protein P4L77_12195 [Sulfuriferula sp.]|nr:hypothetical protein [Sulfuriferula sp.]
MSNSHSNTMQSQLESAITEAVSEQITDVLAHLSVEQKAALESKFNTLAPEVRSSVATKYPALSTVGLYVIRQMIREANNAMASKMRPQWFNTLTLNAASLKSGEIAIREYAEKQLRELAESIDSKESTTLLKKYKQSKDATSKDAHIVQLAGIFGVNPVSLS